MRHLIFRIFLICIFWALLITYVFPWSTYNIKIPFTGSDYKLGLDLQWWIELDYKVDLTDAKDAEDYTSAKETEIIEGLKSIIDKRIQTLNINDSEINDASYGWENHIIVQIPLKWNDLFENSSNIQKAKDAIWKVVKIIFKEARTEITQEDLDFRDEIATSAFEEISSWELFTVISDKTKLNYENIDNWSIDDLSNIVDLEVFNELSEDKLNEVTLNSWDEGYLLLEQLEDETYNYLYISKTPSSWMPASNSEWKILNDEYFVTSSVQFNEAFSPMIELVFNDEWAELFGEISKRLVWKQMAIFVWWEMLTAPVINEAIYGWKAVISWSYTTEEAKELSQNINTWVVPAPIYLTSEKTIDSKIGSSSLQELIVAWAVGFLIIFIFLIYTYRISWIMASVALLLYIVIILAIVKILWITLTLASIAWLILSIWMAIDANILIFERVKDELRKWETILDSTDVWFKKSWSAIWDSNFTGLIVALILFVFWINLIKWFWLMLAIWIVVSLFTVMWISKVLLLFISLKLKNKNIFIGFKK